MTNLQKLWCLTALAATSTFFLAGFHDFHVWATNAPQALPFSQNWTNTGLIIGPDDWSGVPGVVGFRGDDLTVNTGTDPRTLVADGSATPVDVNANQTNPDTFTTGGVAEFEITNPVVALNGSGTADAPFIVLYLNTTGQSSVRVQFNVRDIDGSADDAIQQVNTQFRVGSSGTYTNVTNGYIADATTAGSATQVTPIDVTLPASANNQPIVEVRIMTTNAIGNDEWVGIDDIQVSGGAPVSQQHFIDFNGDGRTDFAIVRNQSGVPDGAITWYYNITGTATTLASQWGISSDFFVPADYDGDNKTDIAVWRPGTGAAFYILQSATSTVKTDVFGQNGDDPAIVDDYDGDGKADVAVYREGINEGDPSFWYYRGTLNNPGGNIAHILWGQNGDFPAPGDYDGDGRADYVIQRSVGGDTAEFWFLQTTAGIARDRYGRRSDVIVPGDYDGDGKTDIALRRVVGNVFHWFLRPSSTGVGGGAPIAIFGDASQDINAQGDYDGDGKTDVAVWRNGRFWVLGSTSGVFASDLGQAGDYPIANFNSH